MIPSAIFTAKTEYGYEIRALDMNFESFVFRVSKEIKADDLCGCRWGIYIYNPEKTGYECLKIEKDKYRIEKENDLSFQFFDVYRFVCEEEIFRKSIIRFQKNYSEYVRLKMTGDDLLLANKTTGFPENGYSISQQSTAEWVKEADTINVARNLPLSIEKGISIDNPLLYSKYLLEKFPSWASYIYIGNQFCPNLLPENDVLIELLNKCIAECRIPVIQFSYMKQCYVDKYQTIISSVVKWCEDNGTEIEIVINDIGQAEMLKGNNHIIISTGLLFAKRRKDPRLKYTSEKDSYLFRMISQDDTDLRKYLKKEFSIDRYSYETCGYEILPTGTNNTVFTPVYQTNTSTYCPVYSMCKYGNRRIQKETSDCPHYCINHTLLYPESMDMRGIYNSLFSIDRDYIIHCDSENTDRIIINSAFAEVLP